MSHLEQQVNALMELCAAQTEQDKMKARQKVMAFLGSRQPQLKSDPEYLTRELLLELGAPDHLLGHPYVIRAVELVLQDQMYIHNISFGLYPQLAVLFDTTASRVERSIRHLVEVTWNRGDVDILQRYFGNTVDPMKGKPTNGEFIARLTNIVKLRMREAA